MSRTKAKSATNSRKTNGATAQQGLEVTFRREVTSLLEQLVTSKKPWALRRARRNFERAYVDFIIGKCEGDRLAAADRLDIGFSTLKEKIRKSP